MVYRYLPVSESRLGDPVQKFRIRNGALILYTRQNEEVLMPKNVLVPRFVQMDWLEDSQGKYAAQSYR